jgi:hypothetical protein
MNESIPILGGCFLGILVFLTCRGRMRMLTGIAGILLVGLSATIASGEYHLSGVYFLVDVAEAASGFFVGMAAVQSFRRLRVRCRRRKDPLDHREAVSI